jgi:hypothetical protein
MKKFQEPPPQAYETLLPDLTFFELQKLTFNRLLKNILNPNLHATT